MAEYMLNLGGKAAVILDHALRQPTRLEGGAPNKVVSKEKMKACLVW
jgi:hypothetical protein